ncbi:MAG: hypothetical protein HY678_00050 [Chloroflexi bacterium]|nr:hypothetical protein [Chloroflexota bacterium]
MVPEDKRDDSLATAWRDAMLVRALLHEQSQGEIRQKQLIDAAVAGARQHAFVEAEQAVAELRSRAVDELSRANRLRIKATRLRRATEAELKLVKQARHDADKQASQIVDKARKEASALVAQAGREADNIRRKSRAAAEAEVKALVRDLRSRVRESNGRDPRTGAVD